MTIIPGNVYYIRIMNATMHMFCTYHSQHQFHRDPSPNTFHWGYWLILIFIVQKSRNGYNLWICDISKYMEASCKQITCHKTKHIMQEQSHYTNSLTYLTNPLFFMRINTITVTMHARKLKIRKTSVSYLLSLKIENIVFIQMVLKIQFRTIIIRCCLFSFHTDRHNSVKTIPFCLSMTYYLLKHSSRV
jgi:hypothetical protein